IFKQNNKKSLDFLPLFLSTALDKFLCCVVSFYISCNNFFFFYLLVPSYCVIFFFSVSFFSCFFLLCLIKCLSFCFYLCTPIPHRFESIPKADELVFPLKLFINFMHRIHFHMSHGCKGV